MSQNPNEDRPDLEQSQPIPAYRPRRTETSDRPLPSGRSRPSAPVLPQFAADEDDADRRRPTRPFKLVPTELHPLPPSPPTARRPALPGSGSLSLGLVVLMALALVAAGLFLPPVSLLDRVLGNSEGDNQAAGSAGNTETIGGLTFVRLDAENPRLENGPLTIEADPGTLTGPFSIHVAAVDSRAYLTGRVPSSGWHCFAAPPAGLTLASPVFSLTQNGAPPASFALHMAGSDDLEPAPGLTALYAYNGTIGRWEFLPAVVTGSPGQMEARVDFLPRCVALLAIPESAREITLSLGLRDVFVTEVAAANPRIAPGSLRPTPTGALNVILAPGFQTGRGYDVLPLVQNFEDPAVIDVATVRTILENPALRTEHARQIAAFVFGDENGYAGVVLDYRALPTSLRDPYTVFVRDLADLLHSQNRTLMVVLPAPSIAGDAMNTAGYDWVALGHAADAVAVLLPSDSAAYGPQGTVNAILAWAVTQVSTDRLRLGLDAMSIEDAGDGRLAPVSLDTALDYLGEVKLTPAESVVPGDTLTAQLTNPLALQVVMGREEDSRALYAQYADSEGVPLRTMWLTDAIALHYRAEWANHYNLGGIYVRNVMDPGASGDLATALRAYRQDRPELISSSEAGVQWTVTAGNTILAMVTGLPGDPVLFEVPTGPDNLTITAAIAGRVLGAVTIPVTAPPQETTDLTPTEAPAASAAGLDFEVAYHMGQLSARSRAAANAQGSWIVLEVPYIRGMSMDGFEGTIEQVHDQGMKVLFSIAGFTDDLATADQATYFDEFALFAARLVALDADGVEVWREMNSATYWPAGQIDPVAYVRLLEKTHEAVKTVNPNALVISGGLQATDDAGHSGKSPAVWNDDVYYAGMAQAGAARYADCIGVAYLQGAVPPDATSGDPRGDTPIYYLPSVIGRVQAAFGKDMPLCITRIGYLAPLPDQVLPESFAWARNTTFQQQGKWLADAVQFARDSGQVRLVILFTLEGDTAFEASAPEQAYALWRWTGCQACVEIRRVMQKN